MCSLQLNHVRRVKGAPLISNAVTVCPRKTGIESLVVNVSILGVHIMKMFQINIRPQGSHTATWIIKDRQR